MDRKMNGGTDGGMDGETEGGIVGGIDREIDCLRGGMIDKRDGLEGGL